MNETTNTAAPEVKEATPPLATEVVPTTPAPESDLIDIDLFSKVKLRVGQVVAAENVEKSKKLLKLQVDLGPELGKRQVLSGIAQSYTAEQMVGKRVIIVANLKPASMMGLESRGMLLAASTPERAIFVISPSDDAPLGSAVS